MRTWYLSGKSIVWLIAHAVLTVKSQSTKFTFEGRNNIVSKIYCEAILCTSLHTIYCVLPLTSNSWRDRVVSSWQCRTGQWFWNWIFFCDWCVDHQLTCGCQECNSIVNIINPVHVRYMAWERGVVKIFIRFKFSFGGSFWSHPPYHSTLSHPIQFGSTYNFKILFTFFQKQG